MAKIEVIKPGYFEQECDKRRYEFDFHNESIVVHNSPVDVVFIGDSITHLWEIHDYFMKFGRVVNRGICGDIVEMVHKRFAADVIQLKPRLVALMIGVNNTWIMCNTEESLHEKTEKETCDFVIGEYTAILDEAKEVDLDVLICSLTPIDCGMPQNRLVMRINDELRVLAKRYGYDYVDYHSHLTQQDGCTLRQDLSDDKLHPNVCGFDIMAEVLTPYLEKHLAD